MVKSFDDFLTLMSPELAGCPVPLIRQKLVNAARVFAERTDSLRATIVVPARENQRRYPLEADFPSDVLKIDVVEIGGRVLEDGMFDFAEADGDDDDVLIIHQEVAFLLVPGAAIEVKSILAPKTDCTCAPAKWLNRWHEGIVGYAMQDLLGMEGSAWSNPNRAIIHAGRFQSAVARARMAARTLKGHERAKGITA